MEIKTINNEWCKLRCANASCPCFAFAQKEVERYNYTQSQVKLEFVCPGGGGG